ncbi:hypothetical protein Q7C36_018491 [Tachysurus vachellii]|uniref:CCHC-type domain-containing protein n=1 Tax=Tachysurus vachellii TaxID=175792 RepID=A0AA88LZR8_TACVA|nr:hypothetical protein Q7C36_018491 [Tachysurus vachellii]
MITLGCKNVTLIHVMSFKRQVFMFLSAPGLYVLFRVWHEGKTYIVYANTGSMKCFKCGDFRHRRLACPHIAQTVVAAGSVGDAGSSFSPVVEFNNNEVNLEEIHITENDDHNTDLINNVVPHLNKADEESANSRANNYVVEINVNKVMTDDDNNDDDKDKVNEKANVEVDSVEHPGVSHCAEMSTDTEIRDNDTLSDISV